MFKLVSDYTPQGDQGKAIDQLVRGIRAGAPHQVFLGVTGSGKTYSVAKVIEQVQRPALVVVHNKTLAAQLYREFRTFFPENAVGYFVSYYDYYQPEAYLPHTDTYIEKDISINDAIDRMRHAATSALLQRDDVIIVASVSCIYGLGSPEAYHGMLLWIEEGMVVDREAILAKLVEIQYQRNDMDFHRGTFRVRGDVVEIFPADSESNGIRVELFDDRVESISEVDPLRGTVIRRLPKVAIYPGSHYVIPPDRMERALEGIEAELHERIAFFQKEGRVLEAQRIAQRTHFDLEMIREVGYCKGIENYSRHLTGRDPGQPPPTLMDYFPRDFLLIADEAHATIPQVGGMYAGDRSRKMNLVEYGFRLPSAFDNRPLTFQEFEQNVHQAVYVSATPGPYELGKTRQKVVEQIIRPTGLMDPEIRIKPARGQVDDLLSEIRERVARQERVLVTTLTKKMAENLTEYYHDLKVRVRYLHSEVHTLDRVEIIRDLRLGKFDVLIGINLLREGLDLPEVSLVAILDADKEGYLRSRTALIQTAGRAARHVRGSVIMYADHTTGSMQAAIDETCRRRVIQMEYNRIHKITPQGIRKVVHEGLYKACAVDYETPPVAAEGSEDYVPAEEIPQLIEDLTREMRSAAQRLEFERAAQLRDRIRELQKTEIGVGNSPRR